jgi:hypothetical protein
MKKNSSQKIWASKPQVPKFTASEKERIIEKVKAIVEKKSKLSKRVSRIDMRGNRIYLYELVEPFNPLTLGFIKPLEDKYLEFPLARLTLKDVQGNNCTADWQRHNKQWITLYTGTLTGCLNDIEKDGAWFAIEW